MKNLQVEKRRKRLRRQKRIRAKIFGTAKLPRLAVFRSSKHIYAQLVDDEKSMTIMSTNDFGLQKASKKKVVKKEKKDDKNKEVSPLEGKVGVAFEVGKLLSQKAAKEGIKKVMFDRGGYKYHGRVKALAEGMRAGGTKF